MNQENTNKFFGVVLDGFLETDFYKSRSKIAQKNYKSAIDHLNKHFRYRVMGHIDQFDVYEFLQTFPSSNVLKSTIAIFQILERLGKIQNNPFDRLCDPQEDLVTVHQRFYQVIYIDHETGKTIASYAIPKYPQEKPPA